MATYNFAAVADAVIAFKKGITLQQGRALRDNPIASREGATGAPYEQAAWHPYDGVSFGDGANGLIYSFDTAGALLSATSPDFEDGYEYRFIIIGLSVIGTIGGVDFGLKRASDGGFLSSAEFPAFSIASSGLRYGAVIELPLCRLINRYPVVLSPLSQPTDANQFDLGAATKVQGAKFTFPSNTGSGLIYMQRRLDCVT